MKRSYKKIIVAIVAFFAMTFGLSVGADVFATKILLVSPTTQKALLAPGEIYEGSIQVYNRADATEPLYYKVSVAPYSATNDDNGKGDYQNHSLEERNARNDIVDWTTVSNGEGKLAPGESAKVFFKVTVPKNAPAGGQYMALVASESTNPELSGDAVGIIESMSIASLFLGQVGGDTIEKAEIVENNIPTFLLDGKLEASGLVENKGNIHADVKYVLQVWPMMSGEEVCTNEEDNAGDFILPETKRYYAQTCNLPSPGIYRAKQTIKIFGEESVTEVTIIYCPIWLMLVIIFGVVMILIWLVMMARGRKKKAARRSSSSEEKEEKDEE